MGRDVLRRVWFRPYRAGMGPKFYLETWDTWRTDSQGRVLIGYELWMYPGDRKARVSLFQGEDFGCSPMHAIDSDACISGIMSFLTLRPGDTDAEYFAEYTELQRAYCRDHAEYLGGAVSARFGDKG